MLKGLYTVRFQTQLGEGAGVVHADGNSVVGGDSSFLYQGKQESAGDGILARVRVRKHFNSPGLFSVFGKDDFIIFLEAQTTGEIVKCKGSSPDAPGIAFTAVLTKVSE